MVSNNISSARLNVYQNSPTDDPLADGAITAHRMSQPWSAGEASWIDFDNDDGTSDGVTTDGSEAEATFFEIPTGSANEPSQTVDSSTSAQLLEDVIYWVENGSASNYG